MIVVGSRREADPPVVCQCSVEGDLSENFIVSSNRIYPAHRHSLFPAHRAQVLRSKTTFFRDAGAKKFVLLGQFLDQRRCRTDATSEPEFRHQ